MDRIILIRSILTFMQVYNESNVLHSYDLIYVYEFGTRD